MQQPRYTSSHVCFATVPEVVRSHIEPGMAVCEIGGGSNPLLAQAERDGLGLRYTLVDIDAGELAKAPEGVHKVELDISSSTLPLRFDVIMSKQVAEHVRDPGQMHRNIREMLNPGGVAIHFFPTLFSAPFVINRLLPEGLAQRVLFHIQPYRSEAHWGKFPAYYRWCRGPTRRQLRRLHSTGFEVEEYVAGFGHTYYACAPLLHRLEEVKARWLLRHPFAFLTSYAIVVLRRPA